MRTRVQIPWRGRDGDIGRVHLVRGEELRWRNAHRLGHPAAVLGDVGRIVMRAKAAIEAGIDALGDAAVAREEGVADAGEDGQGGRRQCLHAVVSGVSLSATSVSSLGSEMPITLNIDPMPPRPLSISRFSAPETLSETSGVAFDISVIARVSMPSRLRKSPCVAGPCTRAPTASAARASASKSTCAVMSAWPGFFRGSL